MGTGKQLEETRPKPKKAPNLGRKFSKEWRKNLSLSHKGQVPWSKGKKLSKEHRRKMSEAQKKNPTKYWLGRKRPDISKRLRGIKRPEITGTNNVGWKGVRVSYSGAHHWIKRELGKPKSCTNPDCVYPRKNKSRSWLKSPKRYEWANISGKYLRDRNDYMSLCPSCHKKYDMGIIKLTKLCAGNR